MAQTSAPAHKTYEEEPAQTEIRSWFSTFDVLQSRSYRIIWIGTILAFTAFNISMTAQGVVAYDLTGNNRAVGFVQFGQGIAMVLLNPITGALVDRWSKRFLIIAAQSVIGLTMLAIAILVITDAITIPILALGSFIVGCAFSFNGPTRTALLKDVVDDGQIGRAMALVQVGGNFARITGPFVAGALLSWSVFGPGGTYLLVAALMGFVTLTMYQIPSISRATDENQRGLLDEIKRGIEYARTTPRILHTLASFHLIALTGFSYYVLMPGFAIDTLGVGTAGLGALLGSAAAGGLLFSLIVATMADSNRVPFLLNASCLMLGLALIATGLVPNFVLAILMMIFVGGGSSAFQTLNNVLAARYAREDYLGRVISLMFMAWGFTALAGLPVGFLADIFGEQAVFTSMGICVCVITALLGVWGHRIAAQEELEAASRHA